jgi:hypothetical protein
VGGNARDVELAIAMFQERQRVQPPASDRVDVEEVTAMIPSACAVRNSRQVGPVRRGAGSTPAACRICQTVDGASGCPKRASSP